ncbi:hypothetical protein [Uliginosibacterium aquaticum]|uniref:Iron uptake protein n=1 Tax=Uliginosibacterium aquaticum TaxID=2731212 RepID=A0ABX2IIL8_9RHOO|nr:hypothetical protein [Uliginosibacterium aquaticum]NSL54459.1 hypothetical protein [Uliginosibacterium aquaticum]
MTTTSSKPAPIRRDWIAKSLAGALLGFTLAMGCSGLLILATAGLAPGTRAQFAMWLVTPIWLGVLSGCFFFSSGLRAWLWLGGANLLVFATLLLARPA